MKNPQSYENWLYLVKQISDIILIWSLQDRAWLMTCFQKNVIDWPKKVSDPFSHPFLSLEDITSPMHGLSREEDTGSLIFAFPKEPRTVLFMKLNIQKDSEWMFARI